MSLGAMPLRKKLLMMKRGGVAWLLRDEFTTDAGSPLTTPRTCEPGPGQLTMVPGASTQSIVGSKFKHTVVKGSTGYIAVNAITRRAGQALVQQFNLGADAAWQNSVAEWNNASSLGLGNIECGCQVIGATVVNALSNGATNTNVKVADTVAATDYVIANVLRSTGAFLFIKGGTFTNWTLLWVFPDMSGASLRPALDNLASITVGTIGLYDYIRAPLLIGAFATDYGIATLHSTSPVSGTPVTGGANGITDLYFTLNGAPSANDIGARLDYRRQDASNYWSAYIKRNAGNTAWDFLLDSVAAGTPTNRLTVTGVGTPDCIRAIHDGNLHDAYTKVTTTWTKRGAQVNNASFASSTGVVPTAGTGGTISQLDVWARTSSLYNVLDAS